MGQQNHENQELKYEIKSIPWKEMSTFGSLIIFLGAIAIGLHFPCIYIILCCSLLRNTNLNGILENCVLLTH